MRWEICSYGHRRLSGERSASGIGRADERRTSNSDVVTGDLAIGDVGVDVSLTMVRPMVGKV